MKMCRESTDFLEPLARKSCTLKIYFLLNSKSRKSVDPARPLFYESAPKRKKMVCRAREKEGPFFQTISVLFYEPPKKRTSLKCTAESGMEWNGGVIKNAGNLLSAPLSQQMLS